MNAKKNITVKDKEGNEQQFKFEEFDSLQKKDPFYNYHTLKLKNGQSFEVDITKGVSELLEILSLMPVSKISQ